MSRSVAGGGRPRAGATWTALTTCCTPAVDGKLLCEVLRAVDWPALLALAEDHGVTQLLAAAAQKLPAASMPASAHEELAERQRAQIFFTLRMSAELFRLTDLFAARFPERSPERFPERSVPGQHSAMLVVKGPALAVQAYGDAAMRDYGDLDFLVRHADIARATQLMMDAGYQPQIPLSAIAAGKIPGQYMFRQSEAKLLVELHNDRTMRYYPRGLPIEQLFARSVRLQMDGRVIPAPAIEDHLILICIHGAKHFWERLMWIADVAALITRHPEMRWPQALAAAEEAGAETMLHGGLLLAANVLQVQLPGEILARAKANAAACAMTGQVLQWLPSAGESSPGVPERGGLARGVHERGLLQRGLFRMRMRGGVARGVGYFLRLLFSPTEEDWDANATETSSFVDVLKRPFRLAKKHGKSGKD
jgi:hypothetical protein